MQAWQLVRLAKLLVEYSAEVRPGEFVTLVGSTAAEPLLLALFHEVLRIGGNPVVVMQPEECAEILLRYGNENQVAFVSPLEKHEGETADVAIHVLAAKATRTKAAPPTAKLLLRNQARKELMKNFLARAAQKKLRWCATLYPCQAFADDAEMSLPTYQQFVFHGCLLHEKDPTSAWKIQSTRQQRLIEFLHQGEELRFQTPLGTDLRIGIKGREWTNCDGHQNLPGGEVFSGPAGDAVDGTICFDLPTVYSGHRVQGVVLVFRHGKIVEARAREGEDFLRRMLRQDEGASRLGEVALGCNYKIQRQTRNVLFDEKIGGTFHVAIGSSYPETGGTNSSGLHWDMVCDLRSGGSVAMDGNIISKDGRFLKEEWPS